MKNMSTMHAIAEGTNEVEKDETHMEKQEKKEVEKLFTVKGWTVKMSRKRMKSWNMVRRNSEVVKANLIAGLTVKEDAPAPCAEKMSEWTKLSLVVDSGACQSVIDAQNMSLDMKFKKRGRQNLDLCTPEPQVKRFPIWERSFCRRRRRKTPRGP